MRPRTVVRTLLTPLLGCLIGAAAATTVATPAWANVMAINDGEISCDPGGATYRIPYHIVNGFDGAIRLTSVTQTPPDPGAPDPATGVVIPAGYAQRVEHVVPAGFTNPRLDFTWERVDDPSVTGSFSAVPIQQIPECQPDEPAPPPPPPPPPARPSPSQSQATQRNQTTAATTTPSATPAATSPTPSPTSATPTRTTAAPAPALSPVAQAGSSGSGLVIGVVVGALVAATIAVTAVVVRRRRAALAMERSAADG